jgi:glycerol kinase
MADYIAAIDQGTSSTRCIIADRAGVIAMAQREHRQFFPHSGWVEHDAAEIWQRTCEVIREAIEQAQIVPDKIRAIGITNQRETAVAWDPATGQPCCRAIVWQDVRTADICAKLGKDRFRQKTGLPTAPYFSATKWMWMLQNVPGLRSEVEAGRAVLGTIDAWLIWNLTGRHATDVTNASRTLLMDLQTCSWDPDLAAAMGIPLNSLPAIASSSDSTAYGVTRADGPFGLEIPVTGCVGDQQAALMGQAGFRPGDLKNTYGTGCFMLRNTGREIVFSKNGLLTTTAYRLGNNPTAYALEGSVAVAGALVRWLRDNLGMIRHSAEIEKLALSVPDNGGVYFVPAFSGLFAPYWRPDARGVMVGLTHHTGRAHIARAALESTAFQTWDLMRAMEQDCGGGSTELKVDGGMVANDLLMQFQADLLQTPVVRPKISETTALGAAFAAGLAVGYWKDENELRLAWKADKTWKPTMEQPVRGHHLKRWQDAVQRSLGLD